MIDIRARDSKHPAVAGSHETRLSEGMLKLIAEVCASHDHLKHVAKMPELLAKSMQKCATAFHRVTPTMKNEIACERGVRIMDSIFRVEMQCNCPWYEDCKCGSDKSQALFYVTALFEGDWEDYTSNDDDTCVLVKENGVLTVHLWGEHEL